ncbi:hypothetical protein ERHA55_31810 [Erwinia rhapontici]|nr:hypothetical protein ERHA55_31810 [Erwinia rhapontici]
MRNPTLLQFFHWYYPTGGKLWPEAAERAQWLAEAGITDVWLPPFIKENPAAIRLATTATICLTSVNLTRKARVPLNTVTKSSCWPPLKR